LDKTQKKAFYNFGCTEFQKFEIKQPKNRPELLFQKERKREQRLFEIYFLYELVLKKQEE
jgi:hypothetical protein